MLVVEDGTIVDGANSYISVTDADDYVADRIPSSKSSTWDGLTTEDKETQLINATEFVDLLVNWDSEIMEDGQNLSWPRLEFQDAENRKIEPNTIPQAVKDAVVEIAVEDLENDIYEEPVKLTSQAFGDSSEAYASPVIEGGNTVVNKMKQKLIKKGYAISRTTFINVHRV